MVIQLAWLRKQITSFGYGYGASFEIISGTSDAILTRQVTEDVIYVNNSRHELCTHVKRELVGKTYRTNVKSNFVFKRDNSVAYDFLLLLQESC